MAEVKTNKSQNAPHDIQSTKNVFISQNGRSEDKSPEKMTSHQNDWNHAHEEDHKRNP